MVLNQIIAHGIRWSKKGLYSVVSHLHRHGIHSSVEGTTSYKEDECIVWMDMEMTGLDVNTDHILEVACLITDNNLNIVSDELNVVVHQPDSILENMSSWCKVTHVNTGLVNESRLSNISIEDAEKIVLKYLQEHVPEKKCPMAGNTVYMDRIFLKKYMTSLDDYLHFRIIDVSSIRDLVSKWRLQIPKLQKNRTHRALPDVRDSITELQLYKNHVFVQK